MSRLSRRPDLTLLVDIIVSCLVAGLSTWWWHQFRLGGLLFGGLVGVALMWRRRRPLVVLAVVVVLCVVAAPIEVRGTRLHEGMLLVSLAVAAHAVVAHAVARALITKPWVVFADEPTGNLDSRSGAEVLGLLRDAVSQLGQTVVMVTHDLNAAAHCDRVVFLQDGRHAAALEAPSPDAIVATMARIETAAAPGRAGAASGRAGAASGRAGAAPGRTGR